MNGPLAHFFIAASAFQISAGGLKGFKNLFNIFLEIALECNRDEWMLRVRRMGWCPCKQPRRQSSKFIGPISLQPFGQVPCRAVCGVAPLANSTGYWRRAAPSSPSPSRAPGKALVQLQEDIEQVLSPGTAQSSFTLAFFTTCAMRAASLRKKAAAASGGVSLIS